jgi:hypothetical protein
VVVGAAVVGALVVVIVVNGAEVDVMGALVVVVAGGRVGAKVVTTGAADVGVVMGTSVVVGNGAEPVATAAVVTGVPVVVLDECGDAVVPSLSKAAVVVLLPHSGGLDGVAGSWS